MRDQQWVRDDEPGTFVIHAPVPDPAGPDDATAGGGQQAAARATAALVRRLRDGQELVQDPQTGFWRPLEWRDVLVLARTRTDFALYEGAFRDAGIPFVPPGRGMLAASVDHAIWFHRPFRMDQWLLYAQQSPVAFGGRGLGLGHFYDEQGTLLASMAQEGVVRQH